MSIIMKMYQITALKELLETLRDDLGYQMEDIQDECKLSRYEYNHGFHFESIDYIHIYFTTKEYAGCGEFGRMYDTVKFKVTHDEFMDLVNGKIKLNSKERKFEIK